SRRFRSPVGTGALAALAGTALTRLGERHASAPWAPPADFDEPDALPLISSNALTLARTALAVAEVEPLLRAAAVAAALSVAATDGNPEAFSAAAGAAGASGGAAAVAERMRTLLG